MINVPRAISAKYPRLLQLPVFVRKPFFALLKKLFFQDRINRFLTLHGDLAGAEFVDAVLEELGVDYSASARCRANIPQNGRVVIVANHPMGGLDALTLIRLISEVRRDFKIVANDMLMQFEPLHRLLLPIDSLKGKPTRTSLKAIQKALANEEAVILFPAGEVSRMRPSGVSDGPWSGGFLKLAERAEAPILPIRIAARNSPLFYAVSSFYKPLSMLLLPGELFRHRGQTLQFHVGAPIPPKAYNLPALSHKRRVKLMRAHLLRLGRKPKPIFATETAIAHPEDRQQLKNCLKSAELLGQTTDGKRIYLYDYERDSPLMREIGRLREITFRKVGEGTGHRRDSDVYDRRYRHLVLWDEERLEVVGSYRLGESNTLLAQGDKSALYSHGLFSLKPGFEPYLSDAIELGRSFVQPRFWGSRALDYLWQGIGAYLQAHPHIRTLFGPVSLSGTLPQAAKEMIVWYYDHYHGHPDTIATAKRPFLFSPESREGLEGLFDGNDAAGDFQRLKEQLAAMGAAVPTLYKQYTDLFEPGGVSYCAFSVDPDFNHCVDGLLIADLSRLKPAKRKRYLTPSTQTAR
jgi:putative hemolysin